MPYKSVWVMPSVFMRHKGVTIYRAYKDDEIEQGPRQFFFCLPEKLSEDEAFDVRDFPGFVDNHPPYMFPHKGTLPEGYGCPTPALKRAWEKYFATDQTANIKAAIRRAINDGVIFQDADGNWEVIWEVRSK